MPLKADPVLSPSVRAGGFEAKMRRVYPVLPLIFLLGVIITQFMFGLRVSNTFDPQDNTDGNTPTTNTLFRTVTNEHNHNHKHKSRHFLTQNSTVLPQWFKDYAISHRAQRLALTERNWKDQRFLIMRCLHTDRGCGGASDRLQSVPTMLMLANMTGRMLFIKWSRPAALQEFLVPPVDGLDWTIPDWLDKHLDFRTLPEAEGKDPATALERAASSDKIMTFRIQIHDKRAVFYDAHKSTNELAYHFVLRDFWDTLFTPSPPVAALIQQNMHDLNLVPGKYVAAHVRTLYLKDESNNTDMIRNGINCATRLKPGWPVYFASDSVSATLAALEYGRSKEQQRKSKNSTATTTATVVARMADTEPLHLDRGIDFLSSSDAWKNVKATAFYDIFVDLYLLAGSQCLAYGVGGYGMWGALLSHDISCSLPHFRGTCNWTDVKL
jgi:hypothetical protein